MLNRVEMSLEHLRVLHTIFSDKNNFTGSDLFDFRLYKENEAKLAEALFKIRF